VRDGGRRLQALAAAHHLLEAPEAELRLARTLQKQFTVEMVQQALAAW
jgi:hypothetical protein